MSFAKIAGVTIGATMVLCGLTLLGMRHCMIKSEKEFDEARKKAREALEELSKMNKVYG